MDSTFSPLGFLIFYISISFYAFIVQSQAQNGNNGAESTFQPPPPPPPLSPPPPSSPFSPPPPEFSVSPTGSPHHHHPYTHFRYRFRYSPPPPRHKMNAGKKVGLLFVGIAVIMQVGVAGYLVIKRRQLLKSHDNRYENCS